MQTPEKPTAAQEEAATAIEQTSIDEAASAEEDARQQIDRP